MVIQSQNSSGRQYIQVQSKIRRQGLYPGRRTSGLRSNFFTNRKTIVSMPSHCACGEKQMDAVSAFPNSDLDEEIYLEQPEGLEEGGKDTVWRLHKSIYGLKQSAQLWHLEVEKYLKGIGFIKTEADSCVFFRNRNGKISIIYLHVHDMIITGDEIQAVKSEIKEKWAMEDLGVAKFAVGIEIERDNFGNYYLHQRPQQI
jgi:hypothetical protein